MRGISPIIAIVLLIMATVALSSVVYLNLVRIGQSSFSTLKNQSEQSIRGIFQEIKIESVTRDTVYVRNKGSADIPISSVAVYVDGSLVEVDEGSSSPVLPAGKIGAVRLKSGLSVGEHVIKVTAGTAKDVGVFGVK